MPTFKTRDEMQAHAIDKAKELALEDEFTEAAIMAEASRILAHEGDLTAEMGPIQAAVVWRDAIELGKEYVAGNLKDTSATALAEKTAA